MVSSRLLSDLFYIPSFDGVNKKKITNPYLILLASDNILVLCCTGSWRDTFYFLEKILPKKKL